MPRFTETILTYTETRYLSDAFTQEAVAFIQEHASQPFFLYLAYNAVHAPYNRAPEVYQEKVSYIPDPDRRNYAAMAVALDTGVGQVIQHCRITTSSITRSSFS